MKMIHMETGGSGAGTVALADNFFLRLRGLLGRSAEELGGLLITPCSQVHCCFMKETIDVVYLDSSGRVVRIDGSMKPWSFGPFVKGADKVLELPEGRAETLGIVPGTVISFKEKCIPQ